MRFWAVKELLRSFLHVGLVYYRLVLSCQVLPMSDNERIKVVYHLGGFKYFLEFFTPDPDGGIDDPI